MCGITGYINLNGEPSSRAIIESMNRTLIHRGPDGEGYFTDGPVALGHTRLAVIDLSAAATQPMLSNDRRYVLIYNGELYNFLELRNELEKKGVKFRTNSDSEVVLASYIQWGSEAVKRFNGMFAFIVWDTIAKSLFMARDRYGIKPLYYAFQNGVLSFGSEIKALLAHPLFSARMDNEALLEYLTFQNFFTDKTLFQDVKYFPAGHYAEFDLQTHRKALPLKQYWNYHFHPSDSKASANEYLEELTRLFEQAVTRQLVSDVEVGTYLSGGIDSGSITAVASSHSPEMKSFTVGCDLRSASGIEMSFDERPQAEALSYLCKTEHYEMVLKAGDLERSLPSIVNHLEEPRVGQSYPNYFASKLAGNFVKVVLAGTGGDELFGGYPWRYYRVASSNNYDEYVDEYYRYWQRLIPNRSLQKVLQPVWNDAQHVWTRDIFAGVLSQIDTPIKTPEDFVNASLYLESKTFLQGLLSIEDKLGMAFSLECRVPFLDNDLVDFALQLPVQQKIRNLDSVVRVNENESGKKK
ncbi:MAG: asparagine synthase (glutamine-hydrolyzing), partial [Bdellovibrionales bacterium]|nr:asparagine synthase (glutamine-hydrolyzing) [Bdellovibrionales bacterium]